MAFLMSNVATRLISSFSNGLLLGAQGTDEGVRAFALMELEGVVDLSWEGRKPFEKKRRPGGLHQVASPGGD